MFGGHRSITNTQRGFPTCLTASQRIAPGPRAVPSDVATTLQASTTSGEVHEGGHRQMREPNGGKLVRQ